MSLCGKLLDSLIGTYLTSSTTEMLKSHVSSTTCSVSGVHHVLHQQLISSIQVAEPLVQIIISSRYCPINKIVNLRSDNARIPRTHILIPEGIINHWSPENDPKRSLENDRTNVYPQNGRQSNWRYPRYTRTVLVRSITVSVIRGYPRVPRDRTSCTSPQRQACRCGRSCTLPSWMLSRADYLGGDHARVPRGTSCSSIDLDRHLAYCRCLSC